MDRRRPPLVLLLAMFLVLAALVWRALGLNASRAARECRSAYDGARSSADTLIVDAHIPDTMRATVTCGAMRYSPGWG